VLHPLKPVDRYRQQIICHPDHRRNDANPAWRAIRELVLKANSVQHPKVSAEDEHADILTPESIRFSKPLSIHPPCVLIRRDGIIIILRIDERLFL
jgi:hypothetical protein